MSTDDPTVFIVDDDGRMRAAMQRLLKSVGLHAESFATPQDFLRTQTPRWSELPGFRCATSRNERAGCSTQIDRVRLQIPIIFITGHGDIPMTVKAMKSGAVEFLTKPFRDQDLLDAIQQALRAMTETRQQQQELPKLKERYEKLTAREREVMGLLFPACSPSRSPRHSVPAKSRRRSIAAT